MNEINCPNCKKAFKVDEAGYAEIVKQVRDKEFKSLLSKELQTKEKEHNLELEVEASKAQNLLKKLEGEKDLQIAKLNSQIDKAKTDKETAVSNASQALKDQIKDLAKANEIQSTKLESEIEKAIIDKEAAISNATQALKEQIKDLAKANEVQRTKFESEIEKANIVKETAVSNATQALKDQIKDLKHDIDKANSERKISENSLNEKHRTEVNHFKDQIKQLRDFKAKLSTKLLGETLEQHCEIEFNKIRSTAFPKAYFEKDNDTAAGTKGDYIFREMTDDGEELLSIMFDMKNEGEESECKKKNEDFFKKLDKDRNEKRCEYAILVSTLEKESEYYNGGIVDVGHKFPKMYVIRPQFFIPIITLLHNAAMKSINYKNELSIIKAEQIDITNFEENLNKFKAGFEKNFDLAGRQFAESIKQIDKSIDALNKAKDNLLKSMNNLRLANSKAQEVSIKKLTSSSPTMRQKFEDLTTVSVEVIDEASQKKAA